MSDVELVIKIHEEEYKRLAYIDIAKLRGYIENGKQIDLERLKSDMKALNCGYPYGLDYLLDCLDKRLGIKINESEEKQ